MFKELKVFHIARPGSIENSDSTLFICRGAACEEKGTYHRYYKEMSILEERVLYTGDAPNNGSLLYRAYSGATATSWYRNEADAWEAAKMMKLSYPELDHAYLNTEKIDPLPSKPFPVRFQLDKNGRPYTRLISHPETEGRHGKGKIFFPDRDFVGADLGLAMVTISREFDNYGFLIGEMDTFKLPSMKGFLDWAWENENHDSEVIFINHPGRGKYLAMQTPGKKEFFRIAETHYDWSTQFIWKNEDYDGILERDVVRYTERKCTLSQLFLEDAWGKSVDLDETIALFYALPDSRSRQGVWIPSCKFHGELVETACKAGFLSQICIEGRQIQAFAIHPENVSALANFSYAEMVELAEKVSSTNHAAETTLQNLWRKGKI